jgi:hypothetical protein
MRRPIALAIIWLSVAAYIFVLFAYHPSFFWEIALLFVIGALWAIVNPDKGKPATPEESRITRLVVFYIWLISMFFLGLTAIPGLYWPLQNTVPRVVWYILVSVLLLGGANACAILHVRVAKRLKPPTPQP